MLDFAFQGTARNFAGQSGSTDNLAGFYAADDYYTDADSNAYSLPPFLGNHDIGRIGLFINQDNPGAADAELVARDELAHALMYFGRGMPVVYYGDEQGFTGDGGDKDARQDMMPSVVASYNDDDLIGTTATTADDNFDETHPAVPDARRLLARCWPPIRRYARVPSSTATARARPASTPSAASSAPSRSSTWWCSTTARPPTRRRSTPTRRRRRFTELWPGTGPALTSDAAGDLTVDVPALGFQAVPGRRRPSRCRPWRRS